MPDINNSQMLPVGTMLDSRYHIEKYLASGGFGNTYVAIDTRFNSRVAIKEFFMRGINHRAENHSTVVVSNAVNQMTFEQQLDKFRREAKRIFDIRNDHIVHVIDLFNANGTSYYVMDFIEGESLSVCVKRSPLTEMEVRNVAVQLLDALGAVHTAGFYHLDVKPGNIMIDKVGHCTLIDFGASKQMDTMEHTSMTASGMAYTPGYAPPEQEMQRMKSIGPWTDFYAVGATLYNLLTGQRPPELDPNATANNDRLFDYPKDVSIVMRQAISKMMNPSPHKRPKDVEQMKEMLEGSFIDEVADTVTIQAPQNGKQSTLPSRQSSKSFKATGIHSKKRIWILGGVVALCMLVAFLFLLNGGKGKNDMVITVEGVSFKMVAVDGGVFTMGATPEQGYEINDNEKPAHDVSLDDFMIGETEVTQELWYAVMGNNPSGFNGEHLPVENVSWDDCQVFLRKLNAKTGKHFRLPTEAEWEYAARGGRNSHHTRYAGSDDLSSVGWYGDYDNGTTHPVAQKEPNELGLYDLSGNVYEWCQDCLQNDYYGKSPYQNPCNENNSSCRVHRGGTWGSVPDRCRVAFRAIDKPNFKSHFIGLRLAL